MLTREWVLQHNMLTSCLYIPFYSISVFKRFLAMILSSCALTVFVLLTSSTQQIKWWWDADPEEENIVIIIKYCTLAKKGPWVVHLPLDLEWGMGRYSVVGPLSWGYSVGNYLASTKYCRNGSPLVLAKSKFGVLNTYHHRHAWIKFILIWLFILNHQIKNFTKVSRYKVHVWWG